MNEGFKHLNDLQAKDYFDTVIDSIFEDIKGSLSNISFNQQSILQSVQFYYELIPKIEKLKFTALQTLFNPLI